MAKDNPQGMQQVHILGRKTPFMGMRTRIDPRMLPEGQLALSTNLRYDSGLAKIRDGSARFTASAQADLAPNTGGRCFAGAYECTLNATDYAFAAWSGTIAASPYTNVYRIDTGTQTEITAASGRYGNTRFANASQPIFMQQIQDEQTGLDYLVMQQPGGEYPRIYSQATGITAVVRPITSPVSGGIHQVVAMWGGSGNYFVVGGSGTLPTYTNSGAHFTAATNGSSPNRNVRLTRDSTADATPATAILAWSSPVNLSTDRMLCMIIDQGTYAYWMTYLKIELYDSVQTAYVTVYDGQDTTGQYQPVFSPIDTTTARQAVGFLLDGIAALSRTSVTKIRFTWNNTTAAPSSSVTLDILCCAGSGVVPGISQHCLTYASTDSLVESIAVYPNAYASIAIGDIGGRPLSNVNIPVQAYMFYSYKVFWINTDSTQLGQGVDTIRLYRQDYAETQYTLVTKITMGSYGGGVWSFTSGGAGSQLTYLDNNDPAVRSLWITPPRKNHVPLPRGGAMANSNGRLFVATYSPSDSGLAGGMSELMGSEFRFPMRFRYGIYTQDAAQPSRATYPGETINGLVATSLTGGNIASLYSFTNRSLNVVDGLDAFSLSMRKRVAPLGCLSTRGFCEDKGRLFWIDQFLQVRMLDMSGFHNLSRIDVNDQFISIAQSGAGGSQVLYTAMAFANEKLYVAFSKGGQTNDNCLVFDLMRRHFDMTLYAMIPGAWISLDAPPSGITYEGFLQNVTPTSAYLPLLVLSSDQRAYSYDNPALTTDVGSNIAFTIQSRDFLATEMWPDEAAIVVNRCLVECDKVASGTINTAVTYSPSKSVRSSSVSVDTSSPKVRRYDDPRNFVYTDSAGLTEAQGGSPHPLGVSANIVISGTLPGGTAFYDLSFEMERRDGEADISQDAY